MIFYEDDEIRGVYCQGSSSFLLLTFSDLIFPHRTQEFFAASPVKALGLSCVGFVAKRSNWFPSANMRASFSAIRPILKSFEIRISYGGSMGGYGALRYGADLGLTHTLALVPQWSLDEAECGFQPGYHEHFNPLMSGMGIKRHQTSGKAFVLFDPYHENDSMHADRIQREHVDAVPIRVVDTHHHVTSVLAGKNNLQMMLEAAILNDRGGLQITVNKIRRKHPIRRRNLVVRTALKKPLLAARAALSFNTNLVEALTGDRRIILDMVIALLQKNEVEANELYRRMKAALLKDDREFLSILGINDPDYQIPCQFTLLTSHQTKVFYNPYRRCLVHTMDASGFGTLEVKIRIFRDNQALLTIGTQGRERQIVIREQLTVSFERDLDAISAAFSFVRNGSGLEGGILSKAGLFLSAEPHGAITRSRSLLSGWEKFKLIPITDKQPV